MLSSTLSSGKTCRPSGTSTTPRATTCSAPSALELGAVEVDAAAHRPVQAGEGVHQRRLAGAVGTEQRHRLAVAHLQVDAVQHRAAP